MNPKEKIYKQHYACFDCRKAFKKTNMREVPASLLHIDDAGRVVICPQCGKRMPDVGFAFKPPRKGDVKGWEEARDDLSASLDHAFRNSLVANVQSSERRKKFIDAWNQRHTVKLATRIGRKKIKTR